MFKDRLNEAMIRAGISNADLARAVGVSRQAVTYWKSGRSVPSSAVAKQVADALRVDPVWLMTGAGVSPEGGNVGEFVPEDAPPPGYVAIKQFRLKFAAGTGGEPDWEEVHDSETVWYQASFFRKRGINPKRCKRACVIGDSMSPLLEDGDSILFEEERDFRPGVVQIADGAIYCLSVDGALKVKRLSRTRKGIVLISENAAKYPPDEYEGEDVERIRIYGRVIEMSRAM